MQRSTKLTTINTMQQPINAVVISSLFIINLLGKYITIIFTLLGSSILLPLNAQEHTLSVPNRYVPHCFDIIMQRCEQASPLKKMLLYLITKKWQNAAHYYTNDNVLAVPFINAQQELNIKKMYQVPVIVHADGDQIKSNRASTNLTIPFCYYIGVNGSFFATQPYGVKRAAALHEATHVKQFDVIPSPAHCITIGVLVRYLPKWSKILSLVPSYLYLRMKPLYLEQRSDLNALAKLQCHYCAQDFLMFIAQNKGREQNGYANVQQARAYVDYYRQHDFVCEYHRNVV